MSIIKKFKNYVASRKAEAEMLDKYFVWLQKRTEYYNAQCEKLINKTN